MIIFGSRTKSAFVIAQFFACAFCHQVAAQRLFHIRTWFTLFFLPVFPFGHGRYTYACAFCGAQTPIDRETAERFTADAEAAEQRRIAAESDPDSTPDAGRANTGAPAVD